MSEWIKGAMLSIVLWLGIGAALCLLTWIPRAALAHVVGFATASFAFWFTVYTVHELRQKP